MLNFWKDPALAEQRRLLISSIGLTVITLTSIFTVSNLARIRREREMEQARQMHLLNQAQRANWRASQPANVQPQSAQSATAP